MSTDTTIVLATTARSPFSAAMLDRQESLETDMKQRGIHRFRKALSRAESSGNGNTTDYAKRLTAATIETLAKAIEGFIADAYAGKRGRRHIAAPLLKKIDGEAAAFITLKIVFALLHREHSVQTMAVDIGREIDEEIQLREFCGREVTDWKGRSTTGQKVLDGAKQRFFTSSNRKHSKAVIRLTVNRHGGEDIPQWSITDRLHVGTKLLELLRDTADIIEFRKCREKKKHGFVYRVVPTEAILKWIEQHNEFLESLTPYFLPMLIPPRPWTTPFGGGYLGRTSRVISLVKGAKAGQLRDLSKRPLSTVYAAVNAIQATPWQINTDLLEIARAVWDSPHGLGNALPSKYDVEIPVKPHDIATNEAARKEWRKKAHAAHSKNVATRSKRQRAATCLGLADEFKNENAIYFPCALDFRGRVYSIPQVLNPQGADLARGLLQFADAKPLKDYLGVSWLAIHGANCYGLDKISIDERIRWVQANSEAIRLCACDPLEHTFWIKAKQPWQFLAFCFEWAGWLTDGFRPISFTRWTRPI